MAISTTITEERLSTPKMKAKGNEEHMIALRKQGKTYEEIAKQYGVSRQHIHKLIGKHRIRKNSVDIEQIAYEGIYRLFADDQTMTFAKLATIMFGRKENNYRMLATRFSHGSAEVRLTVQNIKNLCDYIGEPFEYVFGARK